MNKIIKEKQLKELKSEKRWIKIAYGLWFIMQSFMLSMGLNVAIIFFIEGLGLEIKTNWYLPLSCYMLVNIVQIIYVVTKQYIENIKDIKDRYNNLIDKIK